MTQGRAGSSAGCVVTARRQLRVDGARVSVGNVGIPQVGGSGTEMDRGPDKERERTLNRSSVYNVYIRRGGPVAQPLGKVCVASNRWYISIEMEGNDK